MKRVAFVLIMTMMALTVWTVNGAQALKVTINSKAVSFPDAKPFIDENGRTLIPVRFVFAHNSPTYGSPFEMMNQFGVSYKATAENIAGNKGI